MNTQQPALGGSGTNASGQKDDYVDKGLAAAEQKSGHSLGKDTNEKITDKARGMFEKATGKNVPDKVSN